MTPTSVFDGKFESSIEYTSGSIGKPSEIYRWIKISAPTFRVAQTILLIGMTTYASMLQISCYNPQLYLPMMALSHHPPKPSWKTHPEHGNLPKAHQSYPMGNGVLAASSMNFATPKQLAAATMHTRYFCLSHKKRREQKHQLHFLHMHIMYMYSHERHVQRKLHTSYLNCQPETTLSSQS